MNVRGRRKFASTEEYKLYTIWANMKQRCNNPNSGPYRFYGAKGITISKEWDKFNNFYTDMRDGYILGATLDRIDNKLGYSKENCRWASWKEQQNNRSNNVLYTHDNQALSLTEWAKVTGIARSTLAQRIYVYMWPVEKALTTITRKRG